MTGVKVTNLSEEELDRICREIGDSFFDHEYGVRKDGMNEYGLKRLVNTREMMYKYMKACFVAGYETGCLYSTSERGEGYIIVTYKEHGLTLKSGMKLIRGIVRSLGGLENGIQFLKALSKGGSSYEAELKKKKIPFVNLGMLVVLKEYQGQGYMRQLMEMLYEIADEQNLPIVFDTDAENKMDKYVHLGMRLVKTRNLGDGVFIYDLYRPAQGVER